MVVKNQIPTYNSQPPSYKYITESCCLFVMSSFFFAKCFIFQVVLEPGDVLLVPRHWWHYVESLEPSISINTWIPLVR